MKNSLIIKSSIVFLIVVGCISTASANHDILYKLDILEAAEDCERDPYKKIFDQWQCGFPLAINDNGIVVGSSSVVFENGDEGTVAVAWVDKKQNILDLPYYARNGTGPWPFEAVDINNNGEIISNATNYYNGYYLADYASSGERLYDQTTSSIRYNRFKATAMAINDSGLIVANIKYSERDSRLRSAVVYEPGFYDVMPTILPKNTINQHSIALAINNNDEIAGAFVDIQDDGRSEGVIWDSGEISVNGGVGGYVDISDTGFTLKRWKHDIIYYCEISDGTESVTLDGAICYDHPIYKTNSTLNNYGRFIFRNSPGSLSEPYIYYWETKNSVRISDVMPDGQNFEIGRLTAINNKGQMVGFGELDGQPTPFILTPVNPEDYNLKIDNNDDGANAQGGWLILHGDIAVIIPLPNEQWELTTDGLDYYGDDFYTAPSEGSNVKFEWSLTPVFSGEYKIKASIPYHADATTSATYEIYDENSDLIDTFVVDQQFEGGSVKDVFTVMLQKDAEYTVVVKNSGDIQGKKLLADSIQLERIGNYVAE